MATLEALATRNTGESRVRPVEVLVVEDDADLRHAIVEVFLMKGFRVNAVSNGLDAVELAFRHPYDVIVSDIRLPGIDGRGVLQSLKTLHRKPGVILITAYPDWKVLREVHGMGVSGILLKPFSLAYLAECVDRAAGEGPGNLAVGNKSQRGGTADPGGGGEARASPGP